LLLLGVHLEHDLTVGLFRTVHWVRPHLAVDTGVVGPEFFGRNCINGAVCVFAFLSRVYLVLDVLVQQVELAIFTLIGLTVPNFRDNLTVIHKKLTFKARMKSAKSKEDL
jgi:hypothetical protein